MADLEQVAEAVAFLSAVHPEKAVTKATVLAYTAVLSDVEGRFLLAAAVKLAAVSRWFPKPAELRTAAAELAAGGPLDDAEQAWRHLRAEVRRVGSYGEPDLGDGLLQRVVQSWGWLEVCASTNVVADRAHFLKLYSAARDRKLEQAATPPVVLDLLAGRVARLLPGPEEA